MTNSDLKRWHGLVDKDDRIVQELLCVKCGRDLRGQRVHEDCRECGHPVSDSAHGDYLVHSDPQMVGRLADSARFVMYGTILLSSLVGVGLLVVVFGSPTFEHAVDAGFRIMLAGAMITPVLATVGLVVLTPRRTLAFYAARYLNRGGVRRLVVRIGPALLIAGAAIYYFGRPALFVCQMAWIVVPLAAFLRGLETLMLRVPNAKIARSAKIHFVAVIALGAAVGFAQITRASVRELPDWDGVLLGLTFVCALSGAVIAAGGVRLMLSVQQALLWASK